MVRRLFNAARRVFQALLKVKLFSTLSARPRQSIGSSKRRALLLYHFLPVFVKYSPYSFLLFFHIVNPKPTFFGGFFLLPIPQHSKCKSETSAWTHFVNEVLSPGCVRRPAPQAHRAVLPGALLPRRFTSGCAFTSRGRYDRALSVLNIYNRL